MLTFAHPVQFSEQSDYEQKQYAEGLHMFDPITPDEHEHFADWLEERGLSQADDHRLSGLRHKEYKTPLGNSFHVHTPRRVQRVIESQILHHPTSRDRIHISYGDQETGKDHLEEYDNTGTVSRSTGSVKIPLLISNSRSMGGGGISANGIVRIRRTRDGQVLYQHPKYHHGTIVARAITPVSHYGHDLTHEVLVDGQPHARFKSQLATNRWIKKLGLTVSPEE